MHKKYDYNGGNVTILQVENKSEKAYTVKITAKFKDAGGNVIKTDSKTFEGFPEGWSNYFVFEPGVKYNSVSWGMEMKEYNGETYAQYMHRADNVVINLFEMLSDGKGNMYPIQPDKIPGLEYYLSVNANADGFYHTYNGQLSFTTDVVFFDSNGEIYKIATLGKANLESIDTLGRKCSLSTPLFITDILWVNKDQYSLPSELTNMTVISGFKSVAKTA